MTVTVTWSAATVQVSVRNPAEDVAAQPGFGILGMTERVRLLGGQLSVGFHRPGQFEVSVSVPADPVAAP